MGVRRVRRGVGARSLLLAEWSSLAPNDSTTWDGTTIRTAWQWPSASRTAEPCFEAPTTAPQVK